MAACAHSFLPDGDNQSSLNETDHISHGKEEVDRDKTTMTTPSLKSDNLDENAPNLISLVGRPVAARLISTAGSLLELAKIHSWYFCGANPAGINSSAASQLHARLLDQAELFDGIPDLLKMHACWEFAKKSIYAARVDFLHFDPTGETGRSFKEKIENKFEKWKEAGALPVSDSMHEKKRMKHTGIKRKRKVHVPWMAYGNDFEFLDRFSKRSQVDRKSYVDPLYRQAEVGASALCPPEPATHIRSLSSADDLALSGKDANVSFMEKYGDRVVKTCNINFDDLDSISKLQSTRRFLDIMQKVEEALRKRSDTLNPGVVSEGPPEYQLISDCSELAIDIENEIVIVHYFVCEKYRPKFPELESLVIHPIYYAKVVKQIGNGMNIKPGDLKGVLPLDIASAVSSAASTTCRKLLSEENLMKILAACDRLLSLHLAKKKILELFESRMEFVAPNLSAVVGNAVAANLIWTAGGVLRLTAMPYEHILCRPKRVEPPEESPLCPGLLDKAEVYESTPDPLKKHVSHILALKSLEAARVDCLREDPAGKTGRTIRKEVSNKIAEWQELPLAEQKSIPLPSFDGMCKRKMDFFYRKLRRAKKTMSKRELCSNEDPREDVFLKPFEIDDEIMSALSGIFEFQHCPVWKLLHPHVYSHFFMQNTVRMNNSPPHELYVDTDFYMDRLYRLPEVGTSALYPPERLEEKDVDLDSVSKVQSTQRFIGIMQRVEEALRKRSDTLNPGVVSDGSPEYQLISDCSELAIDIENEIVIVHYFVCEKYRLKFPELESLVIHPIYYAKVVKQIGNEMNIKPGDLEGLLPLDIASTVSSTASTTSGKLLSEENLKKTIAACDRLLSLDLAKKMILEYFESRMEFVAPNLSAVVGNAVAANLIWTAGGVSRLAMRPCGFLLPRPKSVNSPKDSPLCPSLFGKTHLFESTPDPLKKHVCHILALKSVEAARVDFLREDPAGNIGRTSRKEISKTIAEWQELPLAEQRSKPVLACDVTCTRKLEAFLDKIRCAESFKSGGLRCSCKDSCLPFQLAHKPYKLADFTMSGLFGIFKCPPGPGWNQMHPQVCSHWLLYVCWNKLSSRSRSRKVEGIRRPVPIRTSIW